ncbi:MAG: pentapeptide repeat-containing protein [Thermoplasmata archaeon]|nr:pentapeptide repeat-containing protein [Thermoplasmata archaeon]
MSSLPVISILAKGKRMPADGTHETEADLRITIGMYEPLRFMVWSALNSYESIPYDEEEKALCNILMEKKQLISEALKILTSEHIPFTDRARHDETCMRGDNPINHWAAQYEKLLSIIDGEEGECLNEIIKDYYKCSETLSRFEEVLRYGVRDSFFSNNAIIGLICRLKNDESINTVKSMFLGMVIENGRFIGSDLREFSFRGSGFYNCDLSNSLLGLSDLTDSRFDQCILSGIDTDPGALFLGNRFSSTTLRNIKFNTCTPISCSKFSNSRILDSKFVGTCMEYVLIDRTRIDKVDLRCVNAQGMQIRDSELNKVHFIHCVDELDSYGHVPGMTAYCLLNGISIHRSELSDVLFECCLMAGSSFSHSRSLRARFHHSDLSTSSFTDIEIIGNGGCDIDRCTFWDCKFSNITLYSMELRDCNLTNCIVENAKLSNVTLTGCSFELHISGSTLHSVSIRASDEPGELVFKDCILSDVELDGVEPKYINCHDIDGNPIEWR